LWRRGELRHHLPVQEPRLTRAGIWALAVFVGTGGLGALFVAQGIHRAVGQRRLAAEHAARRAGSALESQLARSLSATYALAAAIRQHGRVDDFDHLAAEMLPIYGGIASLQLAPRGVVSRIHPLAGNEAALGHDLFSDPARRAEAEAAVASRQLTLAGPFPLRQGGTGLVGRYPVFRPGRDGTESFWGFTNVLLRLDEVLRAARIPDLEREGYAYELTRVEAGSGRALHVDGRGTLALHPERVPIPVPNGDWTLAVAPSAGWQDVAAERLRYLLALLVATAAGAIAYMLARHPERLGAVVAERTAELKRAYAQLERDSADRRRAEEQLRQAQKMEAIGQLAGGVAHDFNNLLTGILACASAIAEDSPRGGQIEEAARTIEQAAKRAAELTRQLLGFARRGKHLTAPVDLHAAVREAVRLLARTLDPRIAIVTDVAAPRAVVLGDSGQLQQAIVNLAVNARDAMPKGGTLTFATRNVERTAADLAAHPAARPGTYVALAVADTGPGIPADILDRVFEPFFTTKDPGRGTGMGLATVYGIARNHGGFVEVRSDARRGALFTLHLPAHEGAALEERAAPAPAHLAGCRVLVVDDEPVARSSAERALARLGCTPTGCDGGAAAVALLEADPGAVDVALVDLAMPGMDGLDTFRALRALAPALPVVIASGFGPDGRAQEVLDAGAAGFLQKPWTHEALADAVSRAAASGGPA
jgi:signal transduction histidine kinase/ActR/RegA family two-component response regulator